LDSEELIDRKDDYALIIPLDSVNASSFIEAHAPISSLKPSILSQIYLSACDPANLSNYNKTDCSELNLDSSIPLKNGNTKIEEHLQLFSDIFLSTRKEYKPVAKKV
jgi:hypothetical protein